MSRASVSCGNNSNCFHGKQFWPSLAYISLADSKSVRRVARVTTRFREPRGGPSSALAALGTLQPGPPRLSKTRSYPCSASNLYLEPAVFESRVLIGQGAGSIFHSVPRELIVSRGKP